MNWVDCPPSQAEPGDEYAACRAPLGPADFALKILAARETKQVSSHHEALGQALECSRSQVGCSAYVFYRDVLELARVGDAAEHQLLGHALAHEIGHLPLGANSHSASGIMRGHWSQQDFQTIARAYLVFTEQQSRQIRMEASARNSPPQIARVGQP